MSLPTFTVFQDTTLHPASSSKATIPHNTPSAAIKENINPLTGLAFDAQPPSKKRKPSSSSVLKVKPLPSSSKPASKSKKISSSSNPKDKGKKRAILGVSGSRNAVRCVDGSSGCETEQSRTALGNRRAYEFTVMPLAEVTQAYDEGEARRVLTQARCDVEESEPAFGDIFLERVTEENDVAMQDMTSKEATPFVTAAKA